MTRLTNDLRGQIVNMVIAHKFDAIYATLNAKRDDLGERAYDAYFSPPVIAAMDAVQKATNKKALPCVKSFRVNVGGWRVDLTLKSARPTYHDFAWRGDVSFAADSGIGVILQAYATERREIDEKEKHLRQQVSGQIGAFWTFDKLSAAWPEIDRFVRAVERGLPSPNSLPALASHDALNAALDLAPEPAA